ncbi:isochorismatase family cysteine hydrolase [Bacillus sp. ISL-37]|uniref:cysteine hydrolase family protein n=1 Tax=Bacillus sp. ISL-37 TaxID=2819123 RepID=UPI001BE904E8|nr:isochorismatase family cysteine hydrolase [Bacillus sp. ISL-37]MBT2686031.1 cysteine hydrolase [Bacillus sp. ISL-37]
MSIAVIAIDLHRGHLDPAVATMPLPAEKCEEVIEQNRVFFEQCRELNIPIIHLLTQYRTEQEILSNPAWQARANDPNATRKNVARHNLEGMPGVEVIPALWEENDILVDTKKRYDCFIATDLDFVLKANNIKTLWITGVNTNSCCLATSIDASVRDYDVTMVSDCVDTMDGPEYHEMALKVFERAFGKVKSSEQVIHEVKGNLSVL